MSIFISIFLITLLIILIIIVGFDVLLYYKSVFYRIHIGRWVKRDEWLHQISKINLKWLNKTPTVKLTDNECYVLVDMLKGHYRSTTIQSWQEAGSLLGALATTGSKTHVNNYIASKIDLTTGKWKQAPQYVDGAILAYALSKSTIDTEKCKPAFDEIITLIEQCKGTDGTIFYRDFIPDVRFVDTIGFICPFLTFYGVTYNEPKYVDLAIFQIKDYVKKAFLKEPFVQAHAFDLSSNMPLGVYGWGRGSGWFILGIVDMYTELPKEHPEKNYLKELIFKTSKTMLEFQRKDGGFNAMLAVESSRHDSSITSIAGWLFYCSYIITNDNKYLKASKDCVDRLMKVTRRNGVIDFCQGDTKGIGLYATTFDLMPFVQGLTIRLASRLSKAV